MKTDYIFIIIYTNIIIYTKFPLLLLLPFAPHTLPPHFHPLLREVKATPGKFVPAPP